MKLENQVVVVKENESLTSIIRSMVSGEKTFFGIALVVDNEYLLKGVINHGDLLRYLQIITA